VKKETQKVDTNYTHDVNAVKREKSLKSDVFHFYNGKEKWVAFVGIQNDRPYEIFTGLEEKLPTLPPKVTAGNIVRYKRDGASCYDFEYYTEDGEKKVVESINTTFNPEFWNYGKLLSAMLRHRMPLVYIVKTLGDMRFENDSINSWRTGVIRALKRWIKDGTKLGEKCPECGETLVMENGCRRCPSCGWSACG
jgi:ribonucleoside-diphosphate reductase alpha chain